MKIHCYIHYAHCVHATLGKLDREPWSHYELREVQADLEMLGGPGELPEWRVSFQGRNIACEESEHDALAMAAYTLMHDSRMYATKEQAFTGAMELEHETHN